MVWGWGLGWRCYEGGGERWGEQTHVARSRGRSRDRAAELRRGEGSAGVRGAQGSCARELKTAGVGRLLE